MQITYFLSTFYKQHKLLNLSVYSIQYSIRKSHLAAKWLCGHATVMGEQAVLEVLKEILYFTKGLFSRR